MREGCLSLVWLRENLGPKVVHSGQPFAPARLNIDELEVDQTKQ